MSSGEEFEVKEILKERKRKGAFEYLVRWKGFGEAEDSWEPAKSLTHLPSLLKAYHKKIERSRTPSRSRSRGRRNKSRSRSRSRSASRRSEIIKKKKPSESPTRKSASSSFVAKEETASVEDLKPERRVQNQQTSITSTTTEIITKSTTRKGFDSVEPAIKVDKHTTETIQETPLNTVESTMSTRSRLAVRRVQNDEKPQSLESVDEKEPWIWWFADYAVLFLFGIISLVALSFAVESFSEMRGKLTPDLSLLQIRLNEAYDHTVQSLLFIWDLFKDVLQAWGSGTEKPLADKEKLS